MRNNKGAFYRTDEISREPNQCPDWIDLLATKLQVDEHIKSAKTAVEVARERQNKQPSIYEMMSAIVSGQKPKYSSVEEAVKDYQRRTGLEDYLKRASNTNIKALASEIVTEAAHGVCPKCGCSYSECECDEDDAKDGKTDEEDEESKDDDEEDDEEESEDEDDEEEESEDEDDAIDFFRRNLDYGDVRDMTEEEKKDNPGKKKLISEAAEKPALLEKNPAIEHFLTNVIDTNYGIQMPAILHSLIEVFGRDGVDHRVFSDRELLGWINQQLINKGTLNHETPSHLGRGVGTHVDYSGDKDPNKDPFTLLVPDKSAL